MPDLLLSEIKTALERATERDDDWQASLCEIAMIPVVEAVWRAKNNGQSLAVKRVDGIPHKGFDIPDNRARGAAKTWDQVSGYVLYLNEDLGYTYNAVRDSYYSHSASTTWDGCGRSSYCRVIETVRSAFTQATDPAVRASFRDDATAILRDTYGITVVNDLGGSDVT